MRRLGHCYARLRRPAGPSRNFVTLSPGWLRRPAGPSRNPVPFPLRLVEEDARRPSRNLASWFVDCLGGFETLSSFAPQPAGVGVLLNQPGWGRLLLNQPERGRVRPDVRRCWGGSASRLDGGSGARHGRAVRSRWSRDCFTSIPQAKPPSEPSERNTRWHGTNSAGALRAQIEAAARTARGVPKVLANSA